jgi:hypothetical protein
MIVVGYTADRFGKRPSNTEVVGGHAHEAVT